MTLFYRHCMAAAALAAALVLGGCGGGSGGGGGPTVDMSLIFGSGTQADPYLAPSTIPTGTDGGMEDWYDAAPGFWQTSQLASRSFSNGGSMSYAGRAYDTVNDRWLIQSVGFTAPGYSSSTGYPSFGSTGTAHFGATGWYSGAWVGGSVATELNLRVFDDDPAVSQYGTFGILIGHHTNGTVDINSYTVFATGLRTGSANMPTAGTATYAAKYEAIWVNACCTPNEVYTATGGTTTLEADFGAGTIGTGVGGTAAAFGGALAGTTFTLAMSGTISGNAISGGASGTFWNGTSNSSFSTGGMSGNFVGPAAEEVVGSFSVGTNATYSGIQVTGGFWGAQ